MTFRILNSLILSTVLLLQGIGGAGGIGGKGGLGGAKGIPTPAIRCSAGYSSGAGSPSSAAVPICGSAMAGDFTLLIVNAINNANAVAGWTTVSNHTGTIYQEYVAYKALSSGDISTGSVTVTFTGGSDVLGATVTFIGATSGIREAQINHDSTPWTLTSTSAVQSTDIGVYFGATRGAATITIVPGHGSLTTLQNLTSSHNPTFMLVGDQYPAGGAQGNVYTTGVTNNVMQIFVIP